jgi:hypothetical protein
MTLARRVAVLERTAALASSTHPAASHPLPDLTGQPVEAIVDALLGAITDAHRSEAHNGAAENSSGDARCPSCWATIEVASRYGDPTGMAWPDPVKRCLAEMIDAAIALDAGRTP